MELSEFRKTFGNSAAVRLFDYFLDNKYVEFGLTDVLRGANISYNTVRKTWETFIKKTILLPAGKYGKKQLYTVNRKHAVIRNLIALDKALCETEHLLA